MLATRANYPKPLIGALEATGYIAGGETAHGVTLGEEARLAGRWRSFAPDAMWQSESSLRVYFKSVPSQPSQQEIGNWRREVWNEGRAPLLWIVSPQRIDLYNGFRRPQDDGDAVQSKIRTFRLVADELAQLDALAGRVSMETGQFWRKTDRVNKRGSVDVQLLSELGKLESDLAHSGLPPDQAQAIIGQAIFCQYLVDRGIVGQNRLSSICGHNSLSSALRDADATERLFEWLSVTFNGDIFPRSQMAAASAAGHRAQVADFLDGIDSTTGQVSLFPYQFDIIPIELISSIYERFVHSKLRSPQDDSPSEEGVYYTKLPVVSLVLDEVLDGLTGNETVLDLTCGSGVFLVEALRRLVRLRAGDGPWSRDLVRSTLYEQVYGVDKSDIAIRVAAFSLYMAALELDPDPSPPEALRFKRLVGTTLHVADALTIPKIPNRRAPSAATGGSQAFDVIVGNPPWSFKGQIGTQAVQAALGSKVPISPRNPSLAFVQRTLAFAKPKTRFGLVLGANPFYSASQTGRAAALDVVKKLSPVTIVNLANHSDWLFHRAKMPAVAIFGRHRPDARDGITVVQVPWSPVGRRSHAFEISPSDTVRLPLSAVEKRPELLKAASFGKHRDLALLDRLMSRFASLGAELQAVGASFRQGMIRGNRSEDASFACGLPLVEKRNLQAFELPADLPRFSSDRMQWPRERGTFRAPLLLVQEFVGKGGRLVAAVAKRDTVFTDSFYGAALPHGKLECGQVAAGILNSSLAAWFLLMASSTFGLWMRRILLADVNRLPVPNLDAAAASVQGRTICNIAESVQDQPLSAEDWQTLDESVFDLYGLRTPDRVAVRDGLFRASWQWDLGRRQSIEPASASTVLQAYAGTFMTVLDKWLAAREGWSTRAEIFSLAQDDALRVVRFILEESPCQPKVRVQPTTGLTKVLREIEERLCVRLSDTVVGTREIRAYGTNEVVMIKPAARRHWLGVTALDDADTVVRESIAGAVL